MMASFTSSLDAQPSLGIWRQRCYFRSLTRVAQSRSAGHQYFLCLLAGGLCRRIASGTCL